MKVIIKIDVEMQINDLIKKKKGIKKHLSGFKILIFVVSKCKSSKRDSHAKVLWSVTPKSEVV